MRRLLVFAVIAGFLLSFSILAHARTVYPPHGINDNFPPNDLYALSDTVTCLTSAPFDTTGAEVWPDTTATAIVPDGTYVHQWRLYAHSRGTVTSYGMWVKVSPADTDLANTPWFFVRLSYMNLSKTFSYFDLPLNSRVPIDTLYIRGYAAADTTHIYFTFLAEQTTE